MGAQKRGSPIWEFRDFPRKVRPELALNGIGDNQAEECGKQRHRGLGTSVCAAKGGQGERQGSLSARLFCTFLLQVMGSHWRV